MQQHDTFPVNLNAPVEYTLTEAGARIWNTEPGTHEKLHPGARIGGTLLWELMRVFGPRMHMGAPPFFEQNTLHFKQPHSRIPPILPNVLRTLTLVAPEPKVIQIEVYQRPSGISGYMTERVLIALKDDGTLWQSAGGNEWEQVEGP